MKRVLKVARLMGNPDVMSNPALDPLGVGMVSVTQWV